MIVMIVMMMKMIADPKKKERPALATLQMGVRWSARILHRHSFQLCWRDGSLTRASSQCSNHNCKAISFVELSAVHYEIIN